MSLFNLFGRKEKEETAGKTRETNEAADVDAYSGMRVEVTTIEERLLFVAKIMNLRGSMAELHQYSEMAIPREEEWKPLAVKIRGYNDHDRKAVYMEGVISPKEEHKWQVVGLSIVRVANDRAFYRLSTNLEATATTFGGLAAGEKPCTLLNISVGGACIGSEHVYHKGDKFLLKVRLIDDRPESAMFCQVLRITEKENSGFEYGCQFLEMTEDDQKAITQNIFAAQRKRRNNS